MSKQLTTNEFADAIERGDVESIASMWADDRSRLLEITALRLLNSELGKLSTTFGVVFLQHIPHGCRETSLSVGAVVLSHGPGDPDECPQVDC